MTALLTPADFSRHTAAVCRREADLRRHRQPEFAAVLETWAANADRRAREAEIPAQPDLFGAAA